jgi:NAD(P)-dependent dehydrogenase (short-subunit alcohol dehydrogenase family)
MATKPTNGGDMSLDHARTAVITGAGSGIGRALALALSRRGYKVGIVDIDLESAQETLQEIKASGGTGEAYRCDVGDSAQVLAMADHFFETWNEVGLLVNNAGIGAGGFVGEASLEDWEKVIRVNLWGVINGCHAFAPRMKLQGRGHIVNTASTAGLVAVMGFASYSTSKAAVVAFTETLMVELAPFGIGVTVLCPSIVPTNIMEHSMEVLDVEGLEAYEWAAELIDTGMACSRITCEDVARMVIEGIEKDRLFVVTNKGSRSNWRNARMSPEKYFKLLAWLNRKGWLQGLLLWATKRGIA